MLARTFAFRSAPVGGAFSPADFAIAWSSPDSNATLVGGTDYSQWDDDTLTGNHWVQATAGDRPTVLTVNSIRTVSCDGTEHMKTTSNASAFWTADTDEDAEVTLVLRVDLYANLDAVFFVPRDSTTAYALGLRMRTGADRFELFYANTSNADAAASFSTSPTVGQWHYIRVIKDAGNITAHLDGSQVASAANARQFVRITGNSDTPLVLAARGDGSVESDVVFADVAIYKTLLTTGQRTEDDARLAALVSALNAA